MTAEIFFGLLSVGAGVMGWIELVSLPRRSRQEILDRLREQPATGLFEGKQLTLQKRMDLVAKSGMEPSDLESRFAHPRRHLWRAIRHLYRAHKIDVMLVEGPIESAPAGLAGKVGILPILVRGLLPSGLRSDPKRVEQVLSHLSRS